MQGRADEFRMLEADAPPLPADMPTICLSMSPSTFSDTWRVLRQANKLFICRIVDFIATSAYYSPNAITIPEQITNNLRRERIAGNL
jgi:hypothetical protein